ncbi:uncharacterized protein LOC129882864 [Solanum dulcamara]|uniref:uncharacterized protein LOC129882864 n=1 Tax=Solanum dulcamara TaxID=45834 RepID=UPI0024867981|nr:uncharacterized protein LOC129882864 [Solanum dulcamara]
MDFFKSILSDDPDPDPPLSKKPLDSSPEQSQVDPDQNLGKPNSRSDSTPDDGGDGDGDGDDDGGVWSFGGLLKTLSNRSESVLETYRRDLQEFGSGLKKETELFREVASRAVKDLPNSIEVGTTVSHAIDGVIKSTTDIISQGKETLLASSDAEPETPDASRSLNSGRYSRFESQLMNIQSDPNTFCVDPEDLEEYKKWESDFDLKEKSKEIEILIEENGPLEGIYRRVVPNEADNETFWCRYFYKVYKLKQQERVRANLVKRAISIDDDEELSWDVDDDDDNEQESNAKSKLDVQGKEGSVIESSVNEVKKESATQDSTNVSKEVPTNNSEPNKQDSTNIAKEVPTNKSESIKQDSSNVAKEVPTNKSEPIKQDSTNYAKEVPTNKSEPSKQDSTNVVKQATHSDESKTLSSAVVDRKEENQSNVDGGGKSQVVESVESNKDSKKEDTEVTTLSKKEEGVVTGSEGKTARDGSGKDGGVPIASSQKTGADEDDLDWDEIEDIEGNDDIKATSQVASSSRDDLRKRLSVEEDDEDLSWD